MAPSLWYVSLSILVSDSVFNASFLSQAIFDSCHSGTLLSMRFISLYTDSWY